jgi:hypothetical protein
MHDATVQGGKLFLECLPPLGLYGDGGLLKGYSGNE